MNADTVCLLVSRVTERYYAGILPTDDAAFVAVLLCLFIPAETPKEYQELLSAAEWSTLRQHCAFEFVRAIDCLRRSESARWQN